MTAAAPEVEFVDVTPEVGMRVGLVSRNGLVGRGLVVAVGFTVDVQIDGGRKLRFEREGGAWAHRRLARSQFRSVRFVEEPPPDVARVPLKVRKMRGARGATR